MSYTFLKAYITTDMVKVYLKQKNPNTSTLFFSIDKYGDNGSFHLVENENANLKNDYENLLPI